MAKGITVELIDQGVQDILKSSEVQADIQARVNRIQSVANLVSPSGATYDADVRIGNRVVGVVKASTRHARYSNAKHNTLLKAMESGK